MSPQINESIITNTCDQMIRVMRFIMSQLVKHESHGVGVVYDLNRLSHRVRIQYHSPRQILEHDADSPLLVPLSLNGSPCRPRGGDVPFRPHDVVYHHLNGLGLVTCVDEARTHIYFFKRDSPKNIDEHRSLPFHTKTIVNHRLVHLIEREGCVLRGEPLPHCVPSPCRDQRGGVRTIETGNPRNSPISA